jgi:hypothetical protein
MQRPDSSAGLEAVYLGLAPHLNAFQARYVHFSELPSRWATFPSLRRLWLDVVCCSGFGHALPSRPCVRPAANVARSVVIAVVQMCPPAGKQGRPCLGVAVDRGQQLGPCPQFDALPARSRGAFHDDRPHPIPGLDRVEVGGKPHAIKEGAHGSRGACQIRFARVSHDSAAEPVQARVPVAGSMVHEPSAKQWLEVHHSR